jgi:hypothetical protein
MHSRSHTLAPTRAAPQPGDVDRKRSASSQRELGVLPTVRSSLRRTFLLFFATVTSTFAVVSTATWEKSEWQGEPAWVSSQGAVRAVVTEQRSRLIYLGSIDGSFNLLNAPSPQVLPGKNNPWPNQGGHRFWLGPQSRWNWPPLTEWEYAAVQDASSADGVLTLHHAHVNKDYPAITREYAWEGSRLRCTARWRDNGQHYFGLHVVAVNAPFAISARLEKTKDAPVGLVAARMVNPEPPIQLPHPSIEIKGDSALVRSGIKKVKLGFSLQSLSIDRPQGWKLSVLPGPSTVATSDVADQGYLSQVWVGDASNDLAELEQLTPYLKGDASGNCSSTIYIEATTPARQ